MNIDILKKSIESGAQISGFMIFVWQDNDFLARQYARNIVKLSDKELTICFSTEDIPSNIGTMFYGNDNQYYVVLTESVESIRPDITSNNVIIVTKKVSKEVKDQFDSFITDFPKLDEWCIKDYIFSVVGDHKKDIDDMYTLCGGDIYRIDNELSKIRIFDENFRQIILERMILDRSFGDVSKYTILNLSNAIITRNTKEVTNIMREIDNIDVNVFALIAILYNGFKNVVAIQLSKNPTPESTGIKQNQFYAIKKNNIGFYNKNSLYAILKFLTGIDYMIKSGKLPIEISIDYIVYNILSM